MSHLPPLTDDQVAAGNAAGWALAHGLEANRLMKFRAGDRFHAASNELVAVCIGQRTVEDLSPFAASIMRAAAKCQ